MRSSMRAAHSPGRRPFLSACASDARQGQGGCRSSRSWSQCPHRGKRFDTGLGFGEICSKFRNDSCVAMKVFLQLTKLCPKRVVSFTLGLEGRFQRVAVRDPYLVLRQQRSGSCGESLAIETASHDLLGAVAPPLGLPLGAVWRASSRADLSSMGEHERHCSEHRGDGQQPPGCRPVDEFRRDAGGVGERAHLPRPPRHPEQAPNCPRTSARPRATQPAQDTARGSIAAITATTAARTSAAGS